MVAQCISHASISQNKKLRFVLILIINKGTHERERVKINNSFLHKFNNV